MTTLAAAIAARSSCAAVRASRQSASRITLAGAVDDTASDGYAAVVIYTVNVNGVWSPWRTAGMQTQEDRWKSFTLPVSTVGTVYSVAVAACRYGYGAYSYCGPAITLPV